MAEEADTLASKEDILDKQTYINDNQLNEG
jgi:hypothetical protein